MLQLLGAYSADAGPKIAERKLKVPVLGFNCGCFLLDLGQRLASYAGK